MISAMVSMRQRSSFTISHAVTAACLARRAAELQGLHRQPWTGTTALHFEHRAQVVGAVVMSAAFLEATVNEVFDDCLSHPKRGVPSQLPEDRVRTAATLWDYGVPRTAKHTIMDKFKIALRVFDASIDFGKRPAQDVATIIRIRNELVHAEPSETVTQSTIPDDPVTVHEFEKATKGRFAENPLTGPGNAFFPDRMLSAECAAWSVRSAVSFADEFFAALGAKPPYEHVRGDLTV